MIPPRMFRFQKIGVIATMAILTMTLGSLRHRLEAQAKGKPAASKDQADAKGAAKRGDAKNGKKLFASYGCYQCHGRDGQGSTLTGPRLGPKPIEFAAFVAYVRHPAAEMPPYTSKVVSDAELGDMYAFLESLPQPVPAKSIPLLNDSPK